MTQPQISFFFFYTYEYVIQNSTNVFTLFLGFQTISLRCRNQGEIFHYNLIKTSFFLSTCHTHKNNKVAYMIIFLYYAGLHKIAQRPNIQKHNRGNIPFHCQKNFLIYSVICFCALRKIILVETQRNLHTI